MTYLVSCFLFNVCKMRVRFILQEMREEVSGNLRFSGTYST